MERNITELVLIVDKSGSMGGLESDTVGGINAVLAEHRAAPGETYVTVVLFDNEVTTVRDRMPIEQVENLTRADYRVGGCTALLDAVGQTVRHIEQIQGYLPEEYRPRQTIVVITTDGLENASTSCSYSDVSSLIGRKREEGWEFLFLGANIDVAAEASRLGVAPGHAASFVADSEDCGALYAAVGSVTCAMRADSPCSAAPVNMEASLKSARRNRTVQR